MEFRLNSKTTNKLSDRIINSGQFIFNKQLSEPFVQKTLMLGEDTEENRQVAIRRQKDVLDWMSGFHAQAIDNMLAQYNDKEASKFFKDFGKAWIAVYKDYVKIHEKIFNSNTEELKKQPWTSPLWIYKTYLDYHTNNNNIPEAIVALLPQFIGCPRLYDYLQDNCVKVNLFAQYLCFGDWNYDSVTDKLRSMLDRYDGVITAEEEERLCLIFQRGFLYELLHDKTEYMGKDLIDF